MPVTAINTRNQFRGSAVSIHRGLAVSEVGIETAAGIVSATITTSSVDRIPLRVGDSALAVFKATAVLVARLD